MASHTRVSRRRGAVAGAGAAAGVVVALVLAALLIVRAAGLRQTPPYSAPAHWHDVSPPASGPVTSYVASPDVPGLIVACIGDRAGNQSDSGMGPGALWRTRDGGAHWQRLATPAVHAGCELAMPRGGKGTLFADNLFAPTPDQNYLLVSHDAGDTWQTVATDGGAGTGPDLVRARYDAIASAVYRDGTLYAATLPTLDGTSSLVFSASRDDGRTWTPVEPTPDALVRQGFAPLGIAPDFSAPRSWMRLMAPGYATPASGPPTSPAILQRSDDGGRTWHAVAPIGPAANDFRPSSDGILLLTSSAHPGRICALLEPDGAEPPAVGADATGPAANLGASAPAARAPALRSRDSAALAGPPAPLPHRAVLAASDDDGVVWSAWMIGQHERDYGGAVWPGVAMDARGACYAADEYSPSATSAQNTVTIYRASPGATHPAIVASLNGQSASLFAVGSAEGDAATLRLYILATVYSGSQMIVCQGNVCPPEPPLPRPHLIWTPAPAS